MCGLADYEWYLRRRRCCTSREEAHQGSYGTAPNGSAEEPWAGPQTALSNGLARGSMGNPFRLSR